MLHLGADARLALLDVLLGREAFGGLTLKLFTNDVEPDESERAEDYVELEGHGYADVGLDPVDWITAPDDLREGVGPLAVAVYPKVAWIFRAGPPAEVFGYFVVWAASQRLAWSERFVRSQVIEFEGDNIAVVPTFRLRALSA